LWAAGILAQTRKWRRFRKKKLQSFQLFPNNKTLRIDLKALILRMENVGIVKEKVRYKKEVQYNTV
jgi:hypothetical protein